MVRFSFRASIAIFQDAETGDQLYIDTHDKKFRKRFTEAAKRREYELNVAFSRSGVDVLPLSTEDNLVNEIIRFATLRKQRKIFSQAPNPKWLGNLATR